LPGVAHVEVPSALVEQVKVVAKSMKLHAEHDRLSGKPHYHARLATLGAKEVLKKDEYKHAQSVHKAAGCAKHLVGAVAVAAGTGTSCVRHLEHAGFLGHFGARPKTGAQGNSTTRSRRAWADVKDADELFIAAIGGVVGKSVEVGVGGVVEKSVDDGRPVAKDVLAGDVPCSASAPLSSLAGEFVPIYATESYSLSSIGMQLDCMLQAVCSKCEALEVENKKLEKKIVALESLCEAKQDGGSSMSVATVVEGVISRLPSLVGPVVLQVLTASLQNALKECVPACVEEALKNRVNATPDTQSNSHLNTRSPSPGATPDSQSINHINTRLPSPGGVNVSGSLRPSGIGGGGGELVEEPVQWDGLQAGKLRLGSTLTEASGAVDNPKASGAVARAASEPEIELEEGMPVVIVGLVGSPELNGRSGFILGYDAASGRWKVGIDGVAPKKIKAINLVFDEECEFDDDDDGNSDERESCFSGRPDHDVIKYTGSLAAPACH
jgi:hypothetical protein